MATEMVKQSDILALYRVVEELKAQNAELAKKVGAARVEPTPVMIKDNAPVDRKVAEEWLAKEPPDSQFFCVGVDSFRKVLWRDERRLNPLTKEPEIEREVIAVFRKWVGPGSDLRDVFRKVVECDLTAIPLLTITEGDILKFSLPEGAEPRQALRPIGEAIEKMKLACRMNDNTRLMTAQRYRRFIEVHLKAKWMREDELKRGMEILKQADEAQRKAGDLQPIEA